MALDNDERDYWLGRLAGIDAAGRHFMAALLLALADRTAGRLTGAPAAEFSRLAEVTDLEGLRRWLIDNGYLDANGKQGARARLSWPALAN